MTLDCIWIIYHQRPADQRGKIQLLEPSLQRHSGDDGPFILSNYQSYLHRLKTLWLSCCGMCLCIHTLPRFSQFCLATIRPCTTRLDINLGRMVIHRNILLQTSRGNILDAEIIGLWNDGCCYTGVWGKYIR